MAKIKTTRTTQEYNNLASASYSLHEANDCAVKAVAAVCGVTYEEAHATLKSFGRKDRKGTRVVLIDRAIKHFGKKLERVPASHFISRYPKGHRDVLVNVTSHHPERFNKVWKDGESYLMYVSGGSHVLAIVDGVNHDWTKGSAKIACRIFKVTNA